MRSTQNTRPAAKQPWRGYALAAAGLVVVAVVVGIGFAAQQGDGSRAVTADQGSSGSGNEQEIDMSRRIDGDPTAWGSVDAPVVLVEYSDYRCPFCGVFARDTMPDIIEEYVESGQVRIEWRDFPVFGDESFEAAVAGRAAGQQGKFWEFQEEVFANAPERGHVALPRERLIEIAQKVGVADLAAFEEALSSPELLEMVNADYGEASALGVTGTPTFLVNDTPMTGAQPINAFRSVIDAELEQARG